MFVTKVIDVVAYEGRNVRAEISEELAMHFDTKTTKVVDIGCSVGAFTKCLWLANFEQISALDTSVEMGAAQSSFYEAFQKAYDEKDVEAIGKLYTDDCKWVWHSSGKTMNKEAFLSMMPNFMKMPPTVKPRCVYENSEICLFHGFNKFPSGDVEGTLMALKLKDGKCYHVETGSTTIPKDSPNYIE